MEWSPERHLTKFHKKTAEGKDDNNPKRFFSTKFTLNHVFNADEDILLNK